MPKIASRYYSPEFPDGITPSAFRRLGKERKLEVMRSWFFQNFEDPAERTPYESREGGYQWIWGGPYDAREELEAEFGNSVSESIIDELVDEIEAQGYEWAPTPKNSDYDHDDDRDDIVDGDGEWPPLILDGGTEQDKLDGGIKRDPLDEIQGLIDFGIMPNFGGPEEQAAREAAVSSLNQIETALTALESDHTASLIGHNHPPEPIDDDEEKVSKAEIKAEIRAAVAELKAEFKTDTPDVSEVVTLAKRLKKSLFSVTKWLGTKGVESLIMGVGAVVTTYAAEGKLGQLADSLTSAGSAVLSWLQIVMSTPF